MKIEDNFVLNCNKSWRWYKIYRYNDEKINILVFFVNIIMKNVAEEEEEKEEDEKEKLC